MRKKILFLVFCSFLSFLPVAAQDLSYGEFLELYFGITTKDWALPAQKSLLKYPNLKPSNPLYQLLQIAVANNKFPNLDLTLPLKRPALESDLGLLLENNFGEHFELSGTKVLTLETLSSVLQELYKKRKKADSSPELDSAMKAVITKEIFTLLKTKFIHRELLEHRSEPRYEDLWTFVESLGEKYSKYYSPEEGKAFMDALKSEFAGIGVYLAQSGDEFPKILRVIEGSPAEKSGLQAGDLLISAQGKAYEHYPSFEAFSLALKGKAGSQAQLEVKRGNQTLQFQIPRAKLQLPFLSSKKKDNVCYLRIYSFDLGSKEAFFREKEKLHPCEMRIFDLRSNPGGVVDEVIAMLDAFIPQGKPLLTFSWYENKEILTSKDQSSFFFKAPLLILIDEQTASAAEIFAGVLKHYFPEQVKLIGTQSFGKGSVQEVVEFPEHSLLKYTIALWNIANQKESLDKKGLKPDLERKDDPLTPEDELLLKLGIES